MEGETFWYGVLIPAGIGYGVAQAAEATTAATVVIVVLTMLSLRLGYEVLSRPAR